MLLVGLQALEGGDSDSAGMGAAFEAHAGHLGPAEAAFMAHWQALLDLEEGDIVGRRANIWRLSGTASPARLPDPFKP